MLKLRLLTAFFLIPLVILAIFYASRPVFVTISILIFAAAAWEWARLCGWTKFFSKLFYTTLILLLMIGTNLFPDGYLLSIAIGAMCWFGVGIWLFKVRNATQLKPWPRWLLLLSGVFVLIPCWQAIVGLQQRPALLFYLLLMIWACDSGAYFGGRRWGKRKLAPALSPNKTLEGFYTAIVVTMVAAVPATYFLNDPHRLVLSWILVLMPLILAAVIGDLFESALKRMQKVKDSGGILPGHGGLLDRIDSLTAAAPVFACMLFYLQSLNLDSF